MEEADPERVQELEHAAEEKLHELGQEIKDIGQEIHEHLPAPLTRRSKEAKQPAKTKAESGKAEGD
ncbi:MAG: hypothetical protein H0T63_10330 [Pyrinomonadaceae bacterium]|nr:hypothetical protein [Pyrinomonadaceae bacterium]